MAKLLLLQVGNTFAELAASRGDYDAWFLASLGLDRESAWVARPHQGDPLPDRHDFSGVVVTGSAAMVTDREPWSEAVAAFLREIVARERPLLGVCYGHQLLAFALGGQVGDNPAGRMAGTVEVRLEPSAADDPLFGGLPSSLVVHVSHRQRVMQLPSSATLLGQSPHDPCHVYRVGERAWGVQFHPEFDDYVARAYVEQRWDVFVREGRDPESMLQSVRPSDHGQQLLRRFAELARAG